MEQPNIEVNSNTKHQTTNIDHFRLERIKGSLLICISAVGFGLMPVFAKYAYSDGADPLTFLTLRFFSAALLLTLIALIRGENLKLPLKQYLYLAGLGVGGYSAVAGCYFFAITKIPASITSLILYTYPIIVTVYAVLSGVEKFELRKAIALLVSFVGIMLILDSGLEGLNMVGIVLAAGAAVFYSLYIIFSSKLLKTLSPLIATTFIIWFAAIALGLTAMLTGSLQFDFGVVAWGNVIGIAIFSTVCGILTFLMGLERIGPSQACILSTFEPLVTVLFSFWLFGEVLSVVQIAGGGMILIAAILLQLPRRRNVSKFSENEL